MGSYPINPAGNLSLGDSLMIYTINMEAGEKATLKKQYA